MLPKKLYDRISREQCNLKKGCINDFLIVEFNKHKETIYSLCMDKGLIADTYIKMSKMYMPTMDFVSSFLSTYKKLKSTYLMSDSFAKSLVMTSGNVEKDYYGLKSENDTFSEKEI